MTRCERHLLDFVDGFINTHGFSPSYAEIAAALGLASKSAVHRLVTQSVAKGLIVNNAGHQRSIRIAAPMPLHAVPTAALIEELKRRGLQAHTPAGIWRAAMSA